MKPKTNLSFSQVPRWWALCWLLLGLPSLVWAQNIAPVLGALPDVTLAENQDSDVIATAEATDANGDAITYSIAVSPTQAAGFFSVQSQNGEITAAPLDYDLLWQYNTTTPFAITLTVTAFDGNGGTHAQAFQVFVTNEDDAPYTIGGDLGNISLTGYTSIGQSFTTTDAGYLTEFEIDVVTPPASGEMTVQVWKGSDTAPNAAYTGPGHVETELLYETTVEVTASGVQTITLPSPQELDANTVYSVEMFASNLVLMYYFPESYRRGRLLWSNQLYGCCDLHFIATISGGNAAELISPLHGQNLTLNDVNVLFEWDIDSDGKSTTTNTDEDGGDTYALYLQAPGEEVWVVEGINQETYSVPLVDLHSSTVYEWWVVNETTEISSDIRRFLTPANIDNVTGIEDAAFTKPMEAYPNPFAGEVTVSFALRETHDVELVLLDLQGKEVAHLPRKLAVSQGSFVWDGYSTQGTSLPKGMYTYGLRMYQEGSLQKTIYGQLVKQ